MGRAETAERGSRDRGSDVITEVFRSRPELSLKSEEKNFEFNAGGELKPMKLLFYKRGNVREAGKTRACRAVRFFDVRSNSTRDVANILRLDIII